MTSATGYYRIRFGADPAQLVFFRAGLNAWLHGLRWPEPDRIDAVLAVSEACTNAVQHAYPAGEPGDVDVTGRVVIVQPVHRIVVVVRDEGRWRTPASERGYGLRTGHECMAEVHIRHDVDGTVVTMISKPVPVLDLADGGEDGSGAAGSTRADEPARRIMTGNATPARPDRPRD